MNVKLTDAKCFESDIPDIIERIVSLSPAITEILFDIGLEDKVAGVTPYCVRPDRARLKKKVGSYGYVNMELMEKINPDIILTVTGYQDKLISQLRSRFRVFSFELPSTLGGILDLVVKVGIVTGRKVEARGIAADLIYRLNSVKRFNGQKVYIELDLGGPVTFGALSYITDSLSFMKLSSIYSDEMREWILPDFNYVLKMDPEVVIIEPKMFSRRDNNLVERIIEERGWNSMSAIRNGNVFVTPGDLDFFAHHGPSFIREVLPWLASRKLR